MCSSFCTLHQLELIHFSLHSSYHYLFTSLKTPSNHSPLHQSLNPALPALKFLYKSLHTPHHSHLSTYIQPLSSNQTSTSTPTFPLALQLLHAIQAPPFTLHLLTPNTIQFTPPLRHITPSPHYSILPLTTHRHHSRHLTNSTPPITSHFSTSLNTLLHHPTLSNPLHTSPPTLAHPHIHFPLLLPTHPLPILHYLLSPTFH